MRKGCGIAGTVGGVRVAVGNRRMMAGADLGVRGQEWEQQGHTVAFVTVNGRYAALIAR